jgi:Bacterial Ig-like domain (group 1)
MQWRLASVASTVWPVAAWRKSVVLYWLSMAIAALLALAPPAFGQLTPVVQESGSISISVDANGNNDVTGGVLRVNKPTGATVRRAFLMAASVGGSSRVINNGDVTLADSPITWEQSVFNDPLGFNFNNVFAEVTAIVRPLIDAAPAGLNELTITETDTATIDGTCLAVIFDDPNQATNNSIILLFGGQDPAGDRFQINLAAPLDPTSPSARADMGLGISFSFQGTSGSGMVSLIDVNSSRLTSSAGGEDDDPDATSIPSENGKLMTAGGIGDSNDNPPPMASDAGGLRTDDELYNLLPFVNSGDTEVQVDTRNPTNDDNIFFAYFTTSVPAAIGESILLGPLTATNPVNTSHTVMATVVDDNNMPIVNRTVTFTVQSGPNAGATGRNRTNSAGRARFTYPGLGGPGQDVLIASMINSQEIRQESNTVTKNWEDGGGGIITGDVDGNGNRNADDAQLILEVLVGARAPDIPPAINFTAAGDVNADEVINNLDSILILGEVAGRIDPLPDNTRITVTNNNDGTVTVAGAAGAVPSGSSVNLTNATSGTSSSVPAAADDGSFVSAPIVASPEDRIIVDVNGSPARIAVTVGGTLPLIPDVSRLDDGSQRIQ